MPNGSQINDEEINQMIASLKQNEAGASNPIRGRKSDCAAFAAAGTNDAAANASAADVATSSSDEPR